jgi:hypothetical protein
MVSDDASWCFCGDGVEIYLFFWLLDTVVRVDVVCGSLCEAVVKELSK